MRKRIRQETKPWREMTPEEKAQAFDESHAQPRDYARKNFRRSEVAGSGSSPFWKRKR